MEQEGRKDRKKEEMELWTERKRGQETGSKGETEGQGWRKAIKDLKLVNEHKERVRKYGKMIKIPKRGNRKQGQM